MSFDPDKLDSLFILKSTSSTGNDCLGGLISADRFRAYSAHIISDEIGAIEIRHIGHNKVDGVDYPAFRYRDVSIVSDTEDEYYIVCGGETGTSKTIAIGQEAVVSSEMPDGSYVWALIRRVSTGTLGTLAYRRTINFNGLIGMEDCDYGDDRKQYRCCFLYAAENLEITRIDVSSGLTYYFEGDSFLSTTSTDGYTIPDVGYTFIGSGDVSHELTAESSYSLWLCLEPENKGMQYAAVRITYEIDGETYTQLHEAVRRIPDESIAGYALFISDDSETVGGSEVELSTSLPFSYEFDPPESGTEEIRARVVRRNKYNIDSGNIYLDKSFIVDADGNDATLPPDVTSLSVVAKAMGYAEISFVYKDADGFSKADSFSVVAETSQETIETSFIRTTDTEYTFLVGPMSWGFSATITVKSIDDLGNESIGEQSSIRLDNIDESAAYGAIEITSGTAAETHYGNSENINVSSVSIMRSKGHVWFSETLYGFVMHFVLADFVDIRYLYEFALINADITATSGSDPIEFDTDKIYLCAGGNRVAEFDLTNKTLKAKQFSNVITECPYDAMYYETDDRVYFQIADVVNSEMRTWLAIDSDGTLFIPIGVTQTS